MKHALYSLFATAWLFASCQPQPEKKGDTASSSIETPNENPAAPGFNLEESDPKAIELADASMEVMGGRKAWDGLTYLQWTFFERRNLLWNKKTGQVRIEYADTKILVNINDKTGKVEVEGRELTATESLDKYLQRGYEIWVNDSYWLVLPFKLKDSGVTLKHLGENMDDLGNEAHKIEMTFKEVGVTPQNKYHIWIDKNSKFLTQWAFFPTYATDSARFTLPWKNYQAFNGVMLSDDRGNKAITNLKTPTEVPEGTFSDFGAVVF